MKGIDAYLHFFKQNTFPDSAFITFASSFPVVVTNELEFTEVFGDLHKVSWSDRASRILRVDALPASDP